MNILFFYRVYPNYGGVEVVTTVLANRFIKDGHGVIIASIEQPHIELACQLLPDVKLVKLDYPVCSIKNMRKLHRLIINEKIDIIINQWGLPFMSTLLCRVAIKRTSCKLISVLHGAPNTSKLIIKARDKCETVYNPFLKYIYHAIMYLKEELVKASIRYNCSHCEKYVLLSSHFIKPLSDYAHIKRTENIIAIGNPVTIPVYFEEWELKQKKKQLLYVGRMDYENKRVNRIVEAWKVLYEKYVDWELVLVGEGPYKSTLEEYIRRYDIQRVCFKGFQVSPPIQHYKEASHIVELNPDFLIVGMGALMQEKFLLKVKKMGYQGIGFTCGGFVHQTAMNRMHYYPDWVDKMNLRFVYRMYKEKHTRTRYLQAAFLFPVRFIGERIFG